MAGALISGSCARRCCLRRRAPTRPGEFRAGGEGAFRRRWTALADYRYIARDHPQSRYAQTPSCARGTSRRLLPELPAALEAYESLVYTDPRASEVPRALLRTAEIHLFQYLDLSSAAADLERIREGVPAFEGEDEASLPPRVQYGAAGEDERQAAALAELTERFLPQVEPRGGGAMDAGVRAPRERRYADADRSSGNPCIFRRSANPRSRRLGVAQSLEGMGDLQGAIAQYEALRGDAGDLAYVTEKIERLKGVSGSREGQVFQFINTVSTERSMRRIRQSARPRRTGQVR